VAAARATRRRRPAPKVRGGAAGTVEAALEIGGGPDGDHGRRWRTRRRGGAPVGDTTLADSATRIATGCLPVLAVLAMPRNGNCWS